ncbi:MAG: sodium:glutamate symporter [Spirochaetales bacterium]|nr:sodium:glutamate symporter [Spirochaetales bacterium]
MNFEWSYFLDIGIISIALLLATLIRSKIKFFQRFLIPNALTAGLILLPFYNFVGPHLGLVQTGLGEIVYHLLSMSFIAMMLRKTESKRGKAGKGVLWFSIAVTFQLGAQGFIGFVLTLVLAATVVPGLFPSFGLLVPLGYALGPGQAFAIGSGWEQFGFVGAGSVGLTFAAIGFLIASFVGVFLINYGVRHGWLGKHSDEIATIDTGPGVRRAGSEMPVGARLTTDSDAIDSMTVNLGMVVAVYLLTFLFLKLISFGLSFAGDLGTDLATNLWGIGFVFASVMALVVRLILRAAKADHILDTGSLTRISGTSVDLTVAAAVGAISLVVVGQYWLPILVIASIAGTFVIVAVPWMGSRLFTDHRLHRTLILFGAMTGTLPTGLALLRVIDPDFKTPVGSDYVYSSAIVFLLVIPLILMINLPAYAVDRGQPGLIWITLGMLVAYVVIGFVLFLIFSKGRGLKKVGRLWLPEEEEK